jgi:hypothetical protein
MNKDEFTLGGILFVLGLVAFTEFKIQETVFLMGLGVVFMADGLGKEARQDVFKSFLSFFNDLLDALRR